MKFSENMRDLHKFLHEVQMSSLCLSDKTKDARQTAPDEVSALQKKKIMWGKIEKALEKCIEKIDEAIKEFEK